VGDGTNVPGSVTFGDTNTSNTNSRNQSEGVEIKAPTSEPTQATPVAKGSDTSDSGVLPLQKGATVTGESTDSPHSSDRIDSANNVSPEDISVESDKNLKSIFNEKVSFDLLHSTYCAHINFLEE
jgi:hypothetical protein